jgi:hypothetical protein
MTQDIQQTAVVASFDSRSGAEHALVALNEEGVNIKRLSIFDKDFHSEQHPNGCIRSKQFFVLVHGTAEMIVHARAVLGTTGSSHLRTPVASYGSHVSNGLGMS